MAGDGQRFRMLSFANHQEVRTRRAKGVAGLDAGALSDLQDVWFDP
jgi:hypothetical protein